MFYEPQHGHPLSHDPFKAIVAPRPIGWISTVSPEGTPNLAPYSFFNAMSSDPPVVGFASEGIKRSATNARLTGEFVFNLATRDLAGEMNLSSAKAIPEGLNKFEYAEVAMAPSVRVRAPRVAATPAALECRVIQVVELNDTEGQSIGRYVVFGQVVGVYIDEAFLVDGRFDAVAARTIARCGYRDYTVVSEMFQLTRPGQS